MEGIVRRVIDSDSSCLFNAVGYVMDHDKKKAPELRQVIAAVVASDPTRYSEAFLGKPNGKYCLWILNREKWGGAIELAILAEYYGREIAAYDIQTTRCDLYGQGKNCGERVMLIYDGLHYDALAMSPFKGAPEEFDQTIFAVQKDGSIGPVERLALNLIKDQQRKRSYIDPVNFTLRSGVCQIGFIGQKDFESGFGWDDTDLESDTDTDLESNTDSESDTDTDSEYDTDSESNTDDPCANEYANIEVNKVNSSSKGKRRNPVENPSMSGQKRANVSEGVSRGQDLWADLFMEKRFAIPTPALDEIWEDYFQPVKNNRPDPPSKSVGNCSREIKGCVQTHIVIDDDNGVHCKLGNPVPPAHHYFHHDDPRIRNLVRSRLPYFCPLGATHGRNHHTVPSAIDYMNQFNHGPGSKPQATQKTNPGTSSKMVKQNSRKSNIEEVPECSGSWVDPRSNISIPTDDGERRVQAVGGQSAGHWFTSPEGKRANPDAHKFCFKGIDHANKLTDLFLEGMATGKFAWAPSQGSLPTDSAGPCEVGGNNGKQKVDSDLDYQVQIDEPGIFDLNDDTTDFGNNKRRRLEKGNVDITHLTGPRKRAASTMAMNKHPDRICVVRESVVDRPKPESKQAATIKECIELLDQLEEVAKGSELYLFACELFMIKEQREMFEALDPSIRPVWLENKKNKPPNN